MTSPKTILGREPALWIGVIEAAIAFGLTLTDLSTTTQGVILAFAVAVGGCWGAWATSETMLGAALAVIKAGAVLLATFNFDWSATSQAAAVALLTVVIGLIYRTQTTPEGKGDMAGLDQDVIGAG